MSASAYDGSGRNSPQWWPSRHGAEDRLGSGNELTPERTLLALSIPKSGRVIELTRVIEPGMPIYAPRYWNQLLLGHESLEGLRPECSESDFGAFEEVVAQSYQVGCHLDALGHVTIDGRFYNGVHYRDNFTPAGMREMGIETTKPWVTRGVCLDIEAIVGADFLEGGFAITPKHLDDACASQNVEVTAGDALLIHTGWGRLWGLENERYSFSEPGLGWAAAHWVTERKVSLIGADTWGVEVVPFENPRRPYVVHQHFIPESGLHILENVDTSILAGEQISEFLFILSPIKTAGSTASMASPLAII
jgi:kynurenine formamidase